MKLIAIGLSIFTQCFGMQPNLIRGKITPNHEYPANIWVGNCSATVVGPKTVLLAAHCVRNGGQIKFQIKNSPYSATCKQHPSYRSNTTYDWALCNSAKTITEIPYENINTDPTLIRVGDTITLTGYGCKQPGGMDGIDGKLRTGKATVSKTPSKNNADIITNKGSALCFGDSGSSAYYHTGSIRKIISVNSRGDISRISYLSSLTHDVAINFLNEQSKISPICGINAKNGCR